MESFKKALAGYAMLVDATSHTAVREASANKQVATRHLFLRCRELCLHFPAPGTKQRAALPVLTSAVILC